MGRLEGGLYTRIIWDDFPNYIPTFLSRNTRVVYYHNYRLKYVFFLRSYHTGRRLRITSLEHTLESFALYFTAITLTGTLNLSP